VIRLLLLLPTVGSLKIGVGATLSRPINIKARNMPLPKVCNTIYKQEGYVVTGANTLVKNVKPLTDIGDKAVLHSKIVDAPNSSISITAVKNQTEVVCPH